MSKLIEALQIFLKYGDPVYPTHCEHDILYICGIDADAISEEDKAKLTELGFHFGEDGIYSFKYGSA